tara:strand:- start:92 stop:211 length:120 start_codon:yes stop_codon:yes gene_type:complete
MNANIDITVDTGRPLYSIQPNGSPINIYGNYYLLKIDDK